MSWDSGAATRLRIVSIALAALLAACTTTTTTTSAGQAPTAESAEAQVRTDAIDVAADASRRVEVRMELASGVLRPRPVQPRARGSQAGAGRRSELARPTTCAA
jgi:hypothetical protein